jgi:hypothetical protein
MERERGEGDTVRYCVVGGGRCGDKERGLIFLSLLRFLQADLLRGTPA